MESWEEFKAKNPHLKDFLPYLETLNKESPRGRVLISTGFIEEQLREILLAFMLAGKEAERLLEGGNAPLGTLSARTDACYSLGLISQDEHHDLVLIRRIRNEFAHQVHTSFETPSVVSRCKELRHSAKSYTKPDGEEIVVNAAGQFQTAAVALISNLVNRAHYVAKQRRSYGDWPR